MVRLYRTPPLWTRIIVAPTQRRRNLGGVAATKFHYVKDYDAETDFPAPFVERVSFSFGVGEACGPVVRESGQLLFGRFQPLSTFAHHRT
jgi:hypothetical protein